MIEFRIDIIQALEKRGWTQQKIRENKLLGQSSYYAMKNNSKVPGLAGINALCYMLNMQPGSIIRYVPDDQTKEDQEKKDQPGTDQGKTEDNKNDPDKLEDMKNDLEADQATTLTPDQQRRRDRIALENYGLNPDIMDYDIMSPDIMDYFIKKD